jgi:hypothetical protein
MKKTFFVSLLLISAFIVGSSGVAWAPPSCLDYQDYECSYTIYCDGETSGGGSSWCIRLCFDDGFEVYATDFNFYEGWLYPATGKKNLLGTAHIYDEYPGWAGYSVDFKGRALTYRFSYIQDGNGCVEVGKCKPSNNCVFK